MAHLPREILSNHIFLKLPVKSLLRCKCVCKAWHEAWNCVLRDPELARMHLLLNQRQERLLITTSTTQTASHRDIYSVDSEASDGTGGSADAVKLNLNFPAEAQSVQIWGSSNGLLCVVARYRKRKHSSPNNEDMLIWNPSTGDSKLIPDTNPPLRISMSGLVGFGYDSSINDAKIVRVTNFKSMIPGQLVTSRVDIYSIKSNSWEIDKFEAPFSFVGVYAHGAACAGCAVNGSIYWLVYFPRGLLDERENYAQMIAFNIKENKFRKMRLFLPEHFMVLGGTLGRFSVGGTLSILSISRFSARLVVWTMKEGEKEEWTQLMNMNISSLNDVVTQFIRPVYLTRNGKVLVLFYEPLKSSSSVLEKKFVLYDPRINKEEYFSIRGISRRYTFSNVVTYVESLVSPNSIARGAWFCLT